MIRTITLFLLLLFFGVPDALGQTLTDCVKKDIVDKTITITGRNNNLAQVTVEICYKSNGQIDLNVYRQFFSAGLQLNDQRAAKLGHELMVQVISHSADQWYNPVTRKAGTNETTWPWQYNVIPLDTGNPSGQKITFSLRLLYQVGKEMNSEAINFDFLVPGSSQAAEVPSTEGQRQLETPQTVAQSTDQARPPQATQQVATQARPAADTILRRDTVIKVISTEIILPEMAISPEGGGGGGGAQAALVNCIDSVAKYYKQIAGVYSQVSGKALTPAEHNSMSQQYQVYASRFKNYAGNCAHPQVATYKRECDRLMRALDSQLAMVANNNQSPENIASNNENTSGGRKVSFDLKNLYMYIISALFLLMAIKYFYPKLKKKRK